ncbi:MAG: alpha-galactosidase [Microthrixaceae bacterium]
MRDPDRIRPVVVNNWEATGMAFDEQRLVEADRCRSRARGRPVPAGRRVVRLVPPRDDDTQGLGDWDPDPAKLPAGVPPLVRACEDAGIRFGIWLEPEMVDRAASSTRSIPTG